MATQEQPYDDMLEEVVRRIVKRLLDEEDLKRRNPYRPRLTGKEINRLRREVMPIMDRIFRR